MPSGPVSEQHHFSHQKSIQRGRAIAVEQAFILRTRFPRPYPDSSSSHLSSNSMADGNCGQIGGGTPIKLVSGGYVLG